MAQAEREWTPQTHFTIKAGIGGTGFTGGVREAKSPIALRVGASADIPLGQKVGLQPSFYYTRRGTKLWEPVATSARLNYVDVPLLFCFYDIIGRDNAYGLPAGPIMRWKIGPYAGYRLSGEVKNAAAPTRRLDVGGSGGMDVIINRISFSSELSVGAVPVCRNYDGHRLHNMTLILSLGYRL